MFSAVHAQLDELVPRGMPRPELEAGVAALARVEAHTVERRLAFLAEVEALDDGGVSGADVNRSRARRSKRSSKKAVSTAKSLAKMPETRKSPGKR